MTQLCSAGTGGVGVNVGSNARAHISLGKAAGKTGNNTSSASCFLEYSHQDHLVEMYFIWKVMVKVYRQHLGWSYWWFVPTKIHTTTRSNISNLSLFVVVFCQYTSYLHCSQLPLSSPALALAIANVKDGLSIELRLWLRVVTGKTILSAGWMRKTKTVNCCNVWIEPSPRWRVHCAVSRSRVKLLRIHNLLVN